MVSPHSAFGGGGPRLMVISWSLGAIGLAAVMVRRSYASKINGKWRWDFIWASLAAKCALISITLMTIAAANGLGNDIWKISYAQLRNAIFYTFMSLSFGVIAILFAKFSVIALLLQIENGLARKRRIALFIIAGIFTISSLLVIPANFTRCKPVRKIWDPAIKGKCDISFSRYTGMSQSCVTDLILALWPLSIVIHFKQHSLSTKIKIVALMGVATSPGIFSILRAKQLENPRIVSNFTRNFSEFMLYGSLELGLIVILTSIPVLGSQIEQFWNKLKPKQPPDLDLGPNNLSPPQLRYDIHSPHDLTPPNSNCTKAMQGELSHIEIDKTSVRLSNTEASNSKTRFSLARQSFFSDTLSALTQAMKTTDIPSSDRSPQLSRPQSDSQILCNSQGLADSRTSSKSRPSLHAAPENSQSTISHQQPHEGYAHHDHAGIPSL